MKFLILIFLMALPMSSFALVDMRNGNFSDPWIDIEVAGSGFDMSVRRTYNSRTLHNGIFGFGWCSSFETKLTPRSDGTLVLTECGAGNEITFFPQGFKPNDVKTVVDQIIEAMKKSGARFTAKYYNDLADQLFNDSKRREEMAAQYKISTEIKDGSVFQANLRSPDRIIYRGGQYHRTLVDGGSQIFTNEGSLARLSDRNGNFLNFIYANGRLARIVDNNARQLNFTFNSDGKVVRIAAPNGLSAVYEYKGQDLVAVTNAWKNKYTYRYDKLHNLTLIGFPDKTTKEITYDTDRDWVTSFKHRDGCVENYKYETSKKDPRRHYWSTLTKTCKGKVVTQSRYEFFFRPTPTGQGDFLAKVISTVNGNTTEVEYHPIHERPVMLKEGELVTRYEYFDNGLIRSRRVGEQLSEFKYNTNCNKVSEVTVDKEITRFAYDDKCNLTTARNNNGIAVQLSYDRNGRIVGLIDQARRRVNIRYDERLGKPSVVERPGVGTLRVVYKDNGEIDKVESSEGPAVAVQVARAFNNLVELIRPAGIELGI